MRQVTLIAHYGAQGGPLGALVGRCQALLTDVLGKRFNPYARDQIHGTIVGLEQSALAPACNRNLMRYRGVRASMDVRGLCHYLLTSGVLPFSVQFGGFGPEECPFTSRGARPYERSFSCDGDKAVLIGWPVHPTSPCAAAAGGSGGDGDVRAYPGTLEEMRRAAQRFNVLHRWHRSPADLDNDLYLRLGLIAPPLDEALPRAVVEDALRGMLWRDGPVEVSLGASDLCLASYTDDTLPRSTTYTWSLRDERIAAGLWHVLYS